MRHRVPIGLTPLATHRYLRVGTNYVVYDDGVTDGWKLLRESWLEHEAVVPTDLEVSQ